MSGLPFRQPEHRHRGGRSSGRLIEDPRLRFATTVWVVMLTASVSAEPLPSGLSREQVEAIPPDVLKHLPADIWKRIPLSTLKAIPPDLLTKIPPDLLAQIPPNAATMTPEQAKAYYQGLEPAQKKSLKDQAKQIKAQIDGVPGLVDKLKALLRSLIGS